MQFPLVNFVRSQTGERRLTEVPTAILKLTLTVRFSGISQLLPLMESLWLAYLAPPSWGSSDQGLSWASIWPASPPHMTQPSCLWLPFLPIGPLGLLDLHSVLSSCGLVQSDSDVHSGLSQLSQPLPMLSLISTIILPLHLGTGMFSFHFFLSFIWGQIHRLEVCLFEPDCWPDCLMLPRCWSDSLKAPNCWPDSLKFPKCWAESFNVHEDHFFLLFLTIHQI